MKNTIIISILFLLTAASNGQINNHSPYRDNQNFFIKEPGHFYSQIVTKTGDVTLKDINLLEAIDVIVEFKDEPLFLINQSGLLKVNNSDYQRIFNLFISDLDELTKALYKGTDISFRKPIVKKEFYKVFNGVSIEIPKGLLTSLSSLDYVKSVYKNVKVELINEIEPGRETKSLAQNNYEVKGDSIIIGIIDTGIDYMHPALGGGFGPGFKVIGGYDIVDEDADPMDEIGHGTHVAGIAAANGDSLKGIAPNALLMAFKVFSNSKSTFESTIIEAIERAVDPNNDGNYSDKVDIVNMSLGASGTPDDPASIAVNNATKLGVTFCIATGNSYDFITISSPGNAELAISVGAKDTTNKVAEFSSKGPTRKTYSIKPDVIAPGVHIYSSFLNGEYVFASGTSMATPYVTGLCALIKSLHKDWNPEQIKSAIMSTAVLIGEDVMSVGAGIVDIDKALKVSTTSYPSSLSFGYCDINSNIWSTVKQVIIKNESGIIKNYSVKISQPGYYLTASQSNFSLNPGESIKINFSLSVNNSNTPFIPSGSYSYYGDISISSENELLHIPWAFVKGPKLVMQFDKPVMDFLLMGINNIYSGDYPVWDEDFKRAEMLIPNGIYDLFSMFIDFTEDSLKKMTQFQFVSNEQFYFDFFKELKITSKEAKNKISFHGVTENGVPLATLKNWTGNILISFPESSLISGYIFPIDSGIVSYFSNMSDKFTFYTGEFQQDLADEKKVHVISYPPFSGISSDKKIGGKVSFRKLKINISLSPHKKSSNFGFGNTCWYSGENSLGYSSRISSNQLLDEPTWNGMLYITSQPKGKSGFTTQIISDINDKDFNPWLYSDIFWVNGDSVGCYGLKPAYDTYFSHDNGLMMFGNGIPAVLVYQNYYSNMLTSTVTSYGQLGEMRRADIPQISYSLYNESNLIKSGNFSDGGVINNQLSNGKYRLEIQNRNYIVGEAEGNMIIKNNFTLDNNYQNFAPAILTSAQIRNSDNIPVFILNKNESAKFQFSVNTYPPSSARVFIKEENANGWSELTTKKIAYDTVKGNFYLSDISAFTNFDSAALDLKIILTVNNNNSSEIEWYPAVGIGRFRGELKDTSEIFNPASYRLYNNYPNPFNSSTIISYDIPTESKVRIEIFNMLGEIVETMVPGVQSAGNHRVTWNADRFASGIYFFRLSVEGKSYFQKVNKMVLLR